MPLNLQKLQHHLKTFSWRDNLSIEIFPTLDSDLDYLKRWIAENQPLPHITLTEHLTHARASKPNRNWVSEPGQNIALSLAYGFAKKPSELMGLSLVAAMSLVQALKTYGFAEALSIKWPNDVYCQNKKISGILVEIVPEVTAATVPVIIGVGLNVNMTTTTAIDQSWTSLRLVSGREHDRNIIAALLIDQLLADLNIFQTQGFAHFLPVWSEHDHLRGQTITLQDVQGRHQGLVSGIDVHGRLLLQCADGRVTAFVTGDILRSIL